ncbi:MULTISPECIES: methyltransferase [unclassified Azospirillum]|uniref:methyltransferase n=1 Tax=unclassified Azospirillum TaxID=2630922 RepID=UPI000B68BC4A|nr:MULTISPECIES: methyltransferase [unclassified Azospirillum]SNS91418.1 Dimerisation domain-containing protein [Azospirillum sp. RU38E]SNT08450.1 Dimerisation domain-containing protein [Azospirillum sp. RU37A]
MNFHTPHPLQPFWNIAAAPLQAQALEQALSLGLFDILQDAATAGHVARQCQLDPTATGLWLDLLWSMELLTRYHLADAPETPHYRTAPLALRYFHTASEENCAQAWLYRARFLARFAGQWETLLNQGFDLHGEAAPKGSWAQAAREQIGQEQRAVTVPAVLRLLEMLPALPQTGRLLDLGAGPGHVGIALAQRLTGWQGVLCDQPETAMVAQENIDKAGLADRLQALGCDLNTHMPGGGYDLIWCSAVLHFLRDPQEAVRKAANALNAGGLLVLAHAEQTDDPGVAARVLPFYGTVALRGNPLPRPGAVAAMMEAAGLHEIQSLGRIDFPMAPVWLHVGRCA